MKHVPAIVIVDTPVLTDGSLELVGYLPFHSSQEECEDIARRALTGATSHFAVNLHAAVNPDNKTSDHKPVIRHESQLIQTQWHHGEHFISYCVGPVRELARQCDLTENEREHLIALSNKLGGEGKVVYGIASGITTATASATGRADMTLTFAGMLACKPHLFPRTVDVIERLQGQGKKAVYISRDNTAIVNGVAHAAHIQGGPVYSARNPHIHTSDMQLVSGVPSKHYDKILGHYASDAYIVRHDLTELL